MTQTVELPLWLFVLIMLFAAVTALSHFLLPSVRWFFRRRLERAVAKLNTRLTRPIEPFKLARRYDMIQRLIYDPQVTQAIVDQAKADNTPENVAFEKARRYAREIVPSFSAFAYFGFGIRAAQWLATALYDVRTGDDNDTRLKGVSSDATIVFVMNHRSNMDYVLVTYLAANASALSYAVGEWARVWPLSRLIKSMGAYFISRKSRGALYRKVLARYVQMATQGGVTQAIFPEGGLTVDGKLKPLKMGLLSYVVEGFDPKRRDIVFVPVSINYDRVLEDRVLIAANQRGDRRFGAKMSVIMTFILKKLWEKMRGRYTRFGGAAVNFGEPLSLRDFEAGNDIEALAAELKSRIENVMPVMFVPVLSHVFLEADQPLKDEALNTAVFNSLPRYRGALPEVSRETLAKQVAAARTQMLERDMIADSPAGWVSVDAQRALLQFYANSLKPVTETERGSA
ncbi:1-acyl-sn-glycerol-3-phosphate acyltransferase [Tateyamaria pelophila]|uniref:1-acyl-sn-glycerol-3-phosphate acyltransferase n=1 Tax=Tateyamaria pelophila TaxID=328415 RepID=UPI001CC0B9CA|nr:1-acyl-sn-glycerol-3-phosphate acyltransferase [Tateyamaria pelophila]